MRIPLSARLLAYVIAAFVIVAAGILVYDYLSHPKLYIEEGKKDSDRIVSTIIEELTASMRNGGGRAEHERVIRTFKMAEGVKELRVLQVAPVGRHNGAENQWWPMDSVGVAGSGTLARDADGALEFRYRAVISANETCTGCHLTEAGEPIGVVDMTLDLESYSEMISHHEYVFMGWSFGVVVCTIAVFAWSVKTRVQRPLEVLKSATDRLASGDLGHRVRLDTGDEFESVGYSLDEMAAGLQAMTGSLSSLSERYMTLIEMAPDAMVLVDASTGEITDVNPAAIALTGYQRELLKGVAVETLFSEEVREDYADAFAWWIERGRGYLHDVSVVRSDGSTVDVDIGASTVEIGGGMYIQQVWRDLSDRKRYESERRRYVAMLEETVEERTRHLTRSLEELKQSEQRLIESAKLASLGELCAGIAHELNSPMAGILSITEVLSSRLAEDERNAEMLEKLKDAVIRSKKIILDMLVYSRGSQPELEPVSVNEVVSSTITVFRSTVTVLSVELVEDLAPEVPLVMGDKGRLMEVALNLLKNARDAAAESGWIRISTRYEADNGCVVVEVVDSGPGVSEEVGKRIFEPFFTTKEKGGGLNVGLGLSISTTIVKEHGGALEFHNAKPGRGGAIFTLSLRPAGDPEPDPVTKTTSL